MDFDYQLGQLTEEQILTRQFDEMDMKIRELNLKEILNSKDLESSKLICSTCIRTLVRNGVIEFDEVDFNDFKTAGFVQITPIVDKKTEFLVSGKVSTQVIRAYNVDFRCNRATLIPHNFNFMVYAEELNPELIKKYNLDKMRFR